ncbi:MAG: transcription antitermination factor NusB [Pseudomonadota bacterium]
MNPFSSPRQAALKFLAATLSGKASFEEAFAKDGEIERFESRDRAFVRNLVATTLRRLGEIDALIDHVLEKPLPAKAATVRHLLRIGIAQLCFLNTPPHAAVHSSVELLDGTVLAAYKGLANAVLRRLAAEGKTLLGSFDTERLNTPDWLWQSWTRAYGEATCRKIAAAHLREAPLDLTFRKGKEGLAEKLGATRLPWGSFRLPGSGRVDELPGYGEGAWWVQDAAAALPAMFLGDVGGTCVLDLCAAPGGKTAQLADRGGRVRAIDRSHARLLRLRQNLSRLRLEAEVVEADATQWRPETPVPFVLLDAPCSATGTIRRHPDILWQKTPADLRKLTALQDALLNAAVAMTAPGGVLVYSVCSLEPEEGKERIEALLAKGAPLERFPIAPAEVGGVEALLTRQGELRTLPLHLESLGGLDGFFAARLRKLC